MSKIAPTKALRDANRIISEFGLKGTWRTGSRHYQFLVDGKLALTLSQGAKCFFDANMCRQDLNRFVKAQHAHN